MAFTTLVLTPAAGAAATPAVAVSLHSAEPDGSGSNELVGSGYERQAVTWGAPTNGMITADTDPTFSVPAGWVRYVGLWNADAQWLGSIVLGTPFEYPAAGTYIVSPLRLNAENPPA